MKTERLSVAALVVAVTLLVATPVGAVTTLVPGSVTAFRYDGRLARPDGTYDLQFQMYDQLTGGTQIGTTLVVENVPVAATRYTVALDFGAGALPGTARWLQVAWRGGSSTGSFTTVSPRQELLAAPYALGVRLPLAERVQSTGSAFSITNSGTSSGSTAIRGQAANGYGVYGSSTAGAAGVYGTGTASGVIGDVNSSLGSGVLGNNDGSGHGVTATSAHGIGLDAGGATYGVFAGTGSASGVGVYGRNTGGGDGVQGITGGAGASGVFGNNTGGGKGVFGASTTGNGVEGGSTTGNGVQGETTGGFASGVYGRNTGGGKGVFGSSTSGNGVEGTAISGNGVQGESQSGNASGVYGENNKGGNGVAGRSANGVGVYGDSSQGWAMLAAGNVSQDPDSGGWVKAMADVYLDGDVFGCYNSQVDGSVATTSPCGITVSSLNTGVYQVCFGFRVNGRFIMVSPMFYGGDISAEVVEPQLGDNQDCRNVVTFYSSRSGQGTLAQRTNAPFYIFVF